MMPNRRSTETPAKRTLACARRALAGLRVCPEYVIIE
jgi:hypothetical protein